MVVPVLDNVDVALADTVEVKVVISHPLKSPV